MNVHDEMSDSEVLRTASDSLCAMPIASPPTVAAITARGRARRRHRLSAIAGLSVAGAAAGTALVLGLTGVLGGTQAPATIRTASFTLVSNSNGTATLSISPKELLDPAALQSDLAQYGIPAKVTAGSLCTSDPAPAASRRSCPPLRRGRIPRRQRPSAIPPSRSTRPLCRRAPSSASATSSSPRASTRASSRPTSCLSTPAPTPAAAPRLTRTACLTATVHRTASGSSTVAPARPGRNRPPVATALADPDRGHAGAVAVTPRSSGMSAPYQAWRASCLRLWPRGNPQ